MISRIRFTARAIRKNLVRGWQETVGLRSFLQWLLDLLLYRLMAIVPVAGDKVRTVSFKGGQISYRRTRSDFRTVAETWLTRAYEVPVALRRPRVIVDLGANIGATGSWLAARYGCDRMIAVEPVPANAALARRNFAANGVNADLHVAAAAGREGVGYFDDSLESTEGHLADHGQEVQLVTVPGLIGGEQVDLMKMDIEGAEGKVIDGDLGWLDQVRVMITELHPQHTDTDRVIAAIREAGFQYERLPPDPDSVTGPEFMAVFWRPESS